MTVSPTAFDGLSVNAATNYVMLLQRAEQSAPYTTNLTERTRFNQYPVVDQIAYGSRHIPFTVILAKGASITVPQFINQVQQTFSPNKTARTLTATLDDGSTSATLSVYITSLEQTGLFTFEGEFVAADGAWQSASGSSGSSSPLTVGGNYKALPAITITPSGTTLFHRRFTIADNTTRGLANTLIRLTFDSTAVGATTAADYEVFHQGRRVPFLVQNMDNAATTIDLRVDVPPSGSSVVDVFYGLSVNNTLTANKLDDGGMNLASGSFSNTVWVYDDFAIPSLITATGSWRPVKMGQVISGVSFGIVSYDSTSIKFGLRPSTAAQLANDFDGIAVVLGIEAGATNALAGFSRDDVAPSGGALAGNYNMKAAYRKAGDLTWTIVENWQGGAAHTTALDIDDAVEIAFYCEPVDNAANMDFELKASGTASITLASGKVATVTVGSRQSASIITGSLTNTTTGKSISFPTTYIEAGTLLIDCLNKQISASNGILFNPPLPSDGDDWLGLEVGSNSYTNPTNGSAAFAWNNRYSA